MFKSPKYRVNVPLRFHNVPGMKDFVIMVVSCSDLLLSN